MSNQKLKSLRGFQDFLPDDLKYITLIEKIIKDTVHQNGLSEIRTPIVENAEIFFKTIGETSDIINKEMYIFNDKNQESICLRPEGTAAIVRSVLQHNLIYDRGIKKRKFWYYGPMFRYERPQKGRYRQFHQFGVEFFGFNDMSSDVELIQIVNSIFTKLQINNSVLHINSIGNASDRIKYGHLIKSFLEKYTKSLDETSLRTLERNPLRLLDSKDPHVKELLSSLPLLKDNLSHESQKKFNDFLELLDELKISYLYDNTIVRGLDYYNDTVFEWKCNELGSQDAICAGGRYDNLINSLNKIEMPASGIAIGIERILEIIKNKQIQVDVWSYPIISGADTSRKEFMSISQEIRSKHPSKSFFTTDYDASSSSQLKYAKKLNANTAIIIDSSSHKENEVIMKDFVDNSEKIIKINNLDDFLK